MLKVLYEDPELLVVFKPAGVESQAARRFAPDMVSEIKKYLVINKLCTPGKEPYVGVIHRLDKPVSGVMVYAKTKSAAAALSAQVQNHEMEKIYQAVVCGKPEKKVDKFVDYLLKSPEGNYSQPVDKGITGAKRAELCYEVLGERKEAEEVFTLLKIRLETGRHHQIRVQLSSHGLPIYGDGKYGRKEAKETDGAKAFGGGKAVGGAKSGDRASLALCAASLRFLHPKTKKSMEFSITPSGGIFEKFYQSE